MSDANQEQLAQQVADAKARLDAHTYEMVQWLSLIHI